VATEVESEQLEFPDPARIATQQDFGRELTAARTLAGLTVRQVARATGLPISTTGDYFSGRHLPTSSQQAQVLKILRTCGVTDAAELERWSDALRRARRPSGRRPSADAPYRGLARFERQDARWFFGREEIASHLAELVRSEQAERTASAAASSADNAADNGSTAAAERLPLMLVGPSGSGKSSLLRAGLIPRVASEVAVFEPTSTPVADLRRALAETERKPSVVIVDQFEAVFTQCRDETDQSEFVSDLTALASTSVVVLSMRADYYERALRYPALAQALQTRQVLLGAMTASQVRSAVGEPARLARLDVEDGLVDLLLRELAPSAVSTQGQNQAQESAAYGVGSLPLLSHAMLATWERSRGGVITIADYLATGGIANALIQTADGLYQDLQPHEQDLARRLFLHLVTVADDAPPSRATVPLSDLRNWEGADAESVLARFVDERLITVDAEAARITHDALLTAWPRLRDWIDGGIDDLKTRRRITEAARTWDAADRERAALWRGSQLAVAREWAADTGKSATLSRLAADFVDAAVEADVASERAARRRTRGLQRLVAALTALVVAVFGLAVYAFHQRQVATTASNNATSREIAVEAGQVRSQDEPLAAQLSVASYEVARTPQATASLLESTGSPTAARLIDSAGAVESVSLSPDRTVLAVAAADGTLRLWNVKRPGHPAPLGQPLMNKSDDPLYTTAFSPAGTLLATAGAAQTISLWNVSRPAHPVKLGVLTGPTNTVYSVAFSPDGQVLAAGSADDKVRLWDVSDPQHPVLLGPPLTGPAGYVEAVAFSPSGTVLAAASADKTVRLWDIADPARPKPLGRPLTGPASLVTSVAFSPSGQLLAAGSQDDKVWLWRIGPSGGTPDGTLTQATDWVNAVAFSPDGTMLAAGSSDASVRVWNVATRSLIATLPHPQPVTSLAWTGPDHLVSGDADGTVSLWTVPPPVLVTGSPAYDAVFSPNGKILAVSSQNSLQLWSTLSHEQLAAQPVPGTFANTIAYPPHGDLLAVGYGDGMLQLWRAGGSLTPLGSPQRASATGIVETDAFSPNGQLLATGGDDGTMRLWSVSDPAHPRLLATERDSGTYVFGVAFSPNGAIVAAASADDETRLWDVSDPGRPRLIGAPLRGFSSYAISVAFNPKGNLLAVGSADQTVRIWNVAHPRHPVPVGAPLTGPTGYVYGVAFSPDGTTLAAGVTDDTVWLWNVTDPARPSVIATLAGATGHVYSVAYSPDGRLIAAASGDGTARLWSTSPSAAMKEVCANAGQPLTRQEWATFVPGVPYQVPCH
jgi:WD40 repeat protein/transcriptional regulator with XRE-family HTH domain